jgi:hypothetical protein
MAGSDNNLMLPGNSRGATPRDFEGDAGNGGGSGGFAGGNNEMKLWVGSTLLAGGNNKIRKKGGFAGGNNEIKVWVGSTLLAGGNNKIRVWVALQVMTTS